MKYLFKFVLMAAISFCSPLVMDNAANAGPFTADRITLEAGVKNEISVDLAQKYEPLNVLADRKCLDGRAVKDFQGEIVEYWANLECAFCGILEPVKAQRDNPDVCIVVRHIPSAQYGESLKKALAFEALRPFSINAANRFWDTVVPKSTVGLPLLIYLFSESNLIKLMQNCFMESFANTVGLRMASFCFCMLNIVYPKI